MYGGVRPRWRTDVPGQEGGQGRTPGPILLVVWVVLVACVPGSPPPSDRAAPGRDSTSAAGPLLLVVQNDNDRPVHVRLLSGGAQVVRLWVAGLTRDSTAFRRALLSGRSGVVPIIEEVGSDRRQALDPIAVPGGARAVVVAVRSVLSISYTYIR